MNVDLSTAPVLSVQQPWAAALLLAGKAVENRTWKPPKDYRGWLLIHASGQPDKPALTHPLVLEAGRWVEGFVQLSRTFGAILGAVRLTDAHHADTCRAGCSEWAAPDQWHWQVTDPWLFPDPIPVKGQLGLWHPPGEVRALVAEQARAAA